LGSTAKFWAGDSELQADSRFLGDTAAFGMTRLLRFRGFLGVEYPTGRLKPLVVAHHRGLGMRAPGLKPVLILRALRGAEAPLFHGAALFDGAALFHALRASGVRALPRSSALSRKGLFWARPPMLQNISITLVPLLWHVLALRGVTCAGYF
jgi:hypothetical protein